MAKKQKDNKPYGVVSFEITSGNKIMLDMLANYTKSIESMMDEKPNIDGLINYIISIGCNAALKDIAKSHGVKISTLYEILSKLSNERDTLKNIQFLSKMNIVAFADKIVSEQPLFDGQGDLFEGEKK